MMSPARSFWDRFWELIESDSVRPFISLYYTPWLVWAVLATFWLPPVSIIQDSMGHAGYVGWVWAAIPATLVPMIGLVMRHGGSAVEDMTTPLLVRDWFGLFFQWGGHACACILLVLFEISAVKGAVQYDGPSTYAGMTIFVAFLLSAYTVGTGLLSVQCLRKIWKGEELKRRVRL